MQTYRQFNLIKSLLVALCLFAGEALHAQTDKVTAEALRKADQAWKERDYLKAATQYQAVADKTPNDTHVIYRLAESHRRTYNYTAAEDWYAKVTDAETYPIALYYYALVQKRNGKYEEAKEHFDQFVNRKIELNEEAKGVVQQFLEKARIESINCAELARTETKSDVAYFEKNKLGDFSSVYRSKADPIVKRKEAGIIHKEEMPMYGEEAYFFNYQLDGKQRTRLAKLMAAGPGDLSLGTITVARKADKQYYDQLDAESKSRVDRMAVAYRRAVNFNIIVHLKDEDDTYYHSLTRKQQQQLDHAVAYRMSHSTSDEIAEAEKEEDFTYQNVSEVEVDRIEGSSPRKSANPTKSQSLATPETDRFYYEQLSADEQARIDRIIDSQIAKSKGTELALSQEDQFHYNQLSEEEQARIARLLQEKVSKSNPSDSQLAKEEGREFKAVAEKESTSLDPTAKKETTKTALPDWLLTLSKEDQFHYNQLSEEEQARVGRMLQERVAKLNPSDSQLAKEQEPVFHSVAEKESGQLAYRTKKAPQSDLPDWVLALSKEDRFYYENLSPEDRARVDRMVGAGFSARRESTDPQLNIEDKHYYTSLPELERQRLDRMAGTQLVKSVADDVVLAESTKQKSTQQAKQARSAVAADRTSSKGQTIAFENVHFNFDDFSLRSEAVKVLDDLVLLYRQFPNMHIDINAYADDLGDETYNMQLCKKRGQSVRSYLVKQGIKSSTLKIHPRGKDALVQSNDPTIRQINRRVEFHIQGGPETYSSTVQTYILQPDATLYSIAKAFGLTVEEVMELNGLTSNHIEAYRPIRVKNTREELQALPTPMVAYAKHP